MCRKYVTVGNPQGQSIAASAPEMTTCMSTAAEPPPDETPDKMSTPTTNDKSNSSPPGRLHVQENSTSLSDKPKTIEELMAQASHGVDYFQLVKDSISEDDSEWVYNQTANQHNNDLWHDMRRYRITATRSDGVLK